MRLMTEMRDAPDGTKVCCDPNCFSTSYRHRHDAAVAHAMMMALEEIDPDEDPRFECHLIQIKYRVDEIMADWGYSDDGYSADMRIADMGEDRGSK